MTTMRPELEALPRRMAHLPIDARGYPVPWFVAWLVPLVDEGDWKEVEPGTPGAAPDFRVMSHGKWVRAIREKRCWVCGDRLGVHLTFVVGPMCGINRTTGEPPCHRECAEWSARNCPFLARPAMVRRQHDEMVKQYEAEPVGGTALERNPGVTLLWTTKSFRIWQPKPGQHLLTMGDPVNVQWIAEGRPATRAEISHSVTTGLPALYELAEQQEREERVPAVAELDQQVQVFVATYYPPETA